MQTPDGEPGLNYLCEGYKSFFRHIDIPMKFMTQQLRFNLAPSDIVKLYAKDEELNKAHDYAT